jgi:hypothetical protein
MGGPLLALDFAKGRGVPQSGVITGLREEEGGRRIIFALFKKSSSALFE